MQKKHKNPFRFNQIVEKEYFCSRPESTLVSELVESGQNVALIGPRRTGKTSLALEVCRKAKRKVVHSDMMRVDSYAEVIKRLIESTMRDRFCASLSQYRGSLYRLLRNSASQAGFVIPSFRTLSI